MTTSHAKEVLARLKRALPEPRCELDHQDAWQLLIATILSAQSTDARVNMVTPALFKRYPTPKALGDAELPEVEELVRTTGFFRNKAKNVVGASRAVAEQHGGQVPRDLDALIELPGVARKTANVVIGTAYGIPTGFIVDTHAGRVARRLGLTRSEDPAKVESDLCEAFPKSEWVAMGHRFVLHGRYVCTAKKPACQSCPLAEICPSREQEPEGALAARCNAENALVAARGAN